MRYLFVLCTSYNECLVMSALRRLLLVGIILSLLLALSVASIQREKKDSVCGQDCMWLNELKKKKQFPMYGFLDFGEVPHPFCYRGLENAYSYTGLSHIWYTVEVRMIPHPDNGAVLTAGNSSVAVKRGSADVCQGLPSGLSVAYLSPYETSCVGVKHSGVTAKSVSYRLLMWDRIQWSYPLMLVAGLVLLFGAPKMSRNAIICYVTWIATGIVATPLFLLHYLTKKNCLAAILLLAIYFIHAIYGDIESLLSEHWRTVLVYCTASGLLSAAIAFQVGTRPDSISDLSRLAQWTLQVNALLLVFYSSQLAAVSAVFVVTALLLYFCVILCQKCM